MESFDFGEEKEEEERGTTDQPQQEKQKIMLTIKRVATLVSFNQELEQATGCGRDCLGSCCMPGQYTFFTQSIMFSYPSFFAHHFLFTLLYYSLG